MEELLLSLSQNFDNEAQQIVNYIRTNAEYSSDLFEQTYSFTNLTQRPSKIRGRKGAYVFLITQPVSLDYQTVFRWNNVAGAGFKLYNQASLAVGDCLYAGACTTQSLYSRMTAHFADGGSCTGLKLSHPNRRIAHDSVCVYTFILKKELERYSTIVLPQIEKRLHTLLKPKAGSSRVS